MIDSHIIAKIWNLAGELYEDGLWRLPRGKSHF